MRPASPTKYWVYFHPVTVATRRCVRRYDGTDTVKQRPARPGQYRGGYRRGERDSARYRVGHLSLPVGAGIPPEADTYTVIMRNDNGETLLVNKWTAPNDPALPSGSASDSNGDGIPDWCNKGKFSNVGIYEQRYRRCTEHSERTGSCWNAVPDTRRVCSSASGNLSVLEDSLVS
jgi:hypothetical protein